LHGFRSGADSGAAPGKRWLRRPDLPGRRGELKPVCHSHNMRSGTFVSTRTTQLYDRRGDEVNLDEVEKISI